MSENIIVSGMRPTGNLHLGNYFGALKNFVALQEKETCFFFIADYHSLTTHPHPLDLKQKVKTILSQYLACGLSYEKAIIYLQSQVPQVTELYMFLNMNAYIGELQRVASFKEKVRQHPDNVNAGLLTYPTLMAADIIIHKASHVPVGKDQEQHLEMTRTFARRFNSMYGNYFPEPVAYNFGEDLIKIPSLDGDGKMGKSKGDANAIFFIDDAATLRKKIMKAKTDSGPTEPNSNKSESISNLFTLLKLVSKPSIVADFETMYNDCTLRYGDLKQQLADDMEAFICPIRERITEIQNDEPYLQKVLKAGEEKAVASAQKTMRDVREMIGFSNII
ncbi:MAG: tryptophan--tRNA ligase [Bacteroidales bacterium]|jgi:tryptophanyl-tRNA synthetase|nr:tryptophan--tRNA ligase [Bacteroidales bacterium]